MTPLMHDADDRSKVRENAIDYEVWKLSQEPQASLTINYGKTSGCREIRAKQASTLRTNSAPKPAQRRSYQIAASAMSASASARVITGKLTGLPEYAHERFPREFRLLAAPPTRPIVGRVRNMLRSKAYSRGIFGNAVPQIFDELNPLETGNRFRLWIASLTSSILCSEAERIKPNRKMIDH